jgi:hypothetical protein
VDDVLLVYERTATDGLSYESRLSWSWKGNVDARLHLKSQPHPRPQPPVGSRDRVMKLM